MIRWDAPGAYEVVFTTRAGGVSDGPCAEIDADPAWIALNYQVHSTVVHRARSGRRGDRRGDGLWTEESGLPVLALAADCLPIALARANGAAPGVCVRHAGRIGILDGVIEAGVRALGGAVAAAIGPSIGPCCYEVGEEVAAPYRARFGAGISSRFAADSDESE